jgi:predicted ATP-binding protein involved in virulence
MSKADSWLGSTAVLSAVTTQEARANDTARRIAEKTTSIVVIRAGTALAAQNVRIDPLAAPGEQSGEAGTVSRARMLVMGYKDHATIPNTNLQRGDRFKVGGVMYDVIDVTLGISGRLVAFAEAGK